MLGALADAVDGLRQPAYTGENRCVPCTVVNAAIALVTAAGLAVVLPVGPAGAGAVAGGVLVVAGAAIYLRGYLVPGTPRLTKTYLPDRFLRYFDHGGPAAPAIDQEDGVDTEALLVDAGALDECEHRDDLCLTDEFRAVWHDRMEALRASDASRTDLAAILGLPAEALEFEDHGGAFVASAAADHLGGPSSEHWRVGQWESEAAFLADMAAAGALDERVEGWDRLPATERGQVLNGLRVFLDTCPACGGPVTFGEETVESCCMALDVVAVTCDECGARLFEAEWQPPGS